MVLDITEKTAGDENDYQTVKSWKNKFEPIDGTNQHTATLEDNRCGPTNPMQIVFSFWTQKNKWIIMLWKIKDHAVKYWAVGIQIRVKKTTSTWYLTNKKSAKNKCRVDRANKKWTRTNVEFIWLKKGKSDIKHLDRATLNYVINQIHAETNRFKIK